MTPISDYGIIGNTRTAALISKEGSLDWCCFPRFDSPSFFGRLLDKEGGHFQICPIEKYVSEQRYLEDTNVLETTFSTSTGTVRLLDCFTVEDEEAKKEELFPPHEILRIVECLTGTVEMKYDYKPAPGYGKNRFKIRDAGKFGLRCEFGPELVTLNQDLTTTGPNFHLKAGERRFFSLSYNLTAPAVFPPLGPAALFRFHRTIEYWESWVKQCHYHGVYENEVRRSILSLKLLVFAPSGAILAAPTTSLPEEIHGERNWDYRYCWLRDAAFTIHSFLQLGFLEEARAYTDWILHATALTRPRLEVLYTVYGESKVPEKIINWFRGYRDSVPVRVGNAADAQFQLDVYGEVMDAVSEFAPYIEHFDKDKISFLKGIADSVCKLWQIPDEGIWEIRSEKIPHTHSKAMALLALDRFIKLSDEKEWNIPLERYLMTKAKIQSEIEENGFNPDINSYTYSYHDNELDASLLTLPIMSVDLEPDRLKGTVERIHQDLVKDNLTYRYKHQKDGLTGSEGAFVACSFWMVICLSKIGMKIEAKKILDELIAKQNSLGLWPEEIDTKTGEYLGNYPQAFTHTGLINAVLSLKE